MKNPELIKKYKEFYIKIRSLAQDDEIFPEMTDEDFEEFVSQQDWMGIPSFSITKKEMTNSDQGHIGIWMKEEKFVLDLWFNGVRAVERFVNILSSISKKEKEKFIKVIKNLDERYKIRVAYTEKFFSATADWKTVKEIKCKDLNEQTIEELLRAIQNIKEKRDSRQKEIPKSQIATIAISLAEIIIDKENDEELKEILLKLAELTRITHKLKSTSEIKKIKKENPQTLARLNRWIKGYEIGLDEESSESDYLRWKERVKEIEGQIIK